MVHHTELPFLSDAARSKDGGASLYHIDRGGWLSKAPGRASCASLGCRGGCCYFNTVSLSTVLLPSLVLTACLLCCTLFAWNFVREWALLEQISGCLWPVRRNVSMCVSLFNSVLPFLWVISNHCSFLKCCNLVGDKPSWHMLDTDSTPNCLTEVMTVQDCK
jgi:hypothetical protein